MKLWALKQCFECAEDVPSFFFHVGYKQAVLTQISFTVTTTIEVGRFKTVR